MSTTSPKIKWMLVSIATLLTITLLALGQGQGYTPSIDHPPPANLSSGAAASANAVLSAGANPTNLTLTPVTSPNPGNLYIGQIGNDWLFGPTSWQTGGFMDFHQDGSFSFANSNHQASVSLIGGEIVYTAPTLLVDSTGPAQFGRVYMGLLDFLMSSNPITGNAVVITNGGITANGTPSVTFNGPVKGLGTNENLGEFWACDFGFSPTNTAAGNSAAFDACIAACSNAGGGTIRFGGRFTNNTATINQTIPLAGEHLLNGQSTRFRLVGDGNITISSTATTTRHGVLWGSFDAQGFQLTGTGTNISDIYPYTNHVGIYEVGFYDPTLLNVFVTGFGQGFTFEQVGANRGALVTGCEALSCDIGFAIGDQCDWWHSIQSPGRSCQFGADIACVTPDPRDNSGYSGVIYGGTNVLGSSHLKIDGGMWNYNSCDIVAGKGSQLIGLISGHYDQNSIHFQLGHNNTQVGIAYEGEGDQMALDGFQAEDGSPLLRTNILVNSVSGSQFLSLKRCAIGGGGVGYGIVGPVNVVQSDPDNVFNVGTNWIGGNFPNPFAASQASWDWRENSALEWHYFLSHGSAFSAGESIFELDGDFGYEQGTLFSVVTKDGSFIDRNRLDYINQADNTGLLNLVNASLTVGDNLTNSSEGVPLLNGKAQIVTNGFIAWVCYKTNNNPGNQFTNLPWGSICSTTNGGTYRLSNDVWSWP